MEPKDIQLPEGWHIQKSGGRPKKTNRHVAVLLAQLLRTIVHHEKTYQANEWIMNHWANRKNTDDSVIRREIRMAKLELEKHILSFSGEAIMAVQTPIKNGATGWFWSKDLHEALPIQTKNVKFEQTFEAFNMNPISKAVIAYTQRV